MCSSATAVPCRQQVDLARGTTGRLFNERLFGDEEIEDTGDGFEPGGGADLAASVTINVNCTSE